MFFKDLFTTYLLEVFLISLSIYFSIKAGKMRKASSTTFAFFAFAVANVAFQIFNLLLEISRGNEYLQGKALTSIFSICCLSTMSICAFCWFNFVEDATYNKLLNTYKKKALWSIPVYIFIGLCISSIFTGWIFTFDANDKYQVGSLFFLQYIFIFGYVALAIIVSLLNFFARKRKRYTDLILVVIMLIDTLAVVIQLILQVNMMHMAIVLMVLISYITVFTEEVQQIKSNLEQEHILKEKEEEKLRIKELELKHSEFRSDALSYLTEHEGDITSFLEFFAVRLRELIGCDQVIYRDINNVTFMKNAPEFGDEYIVPQEICRNCRHSNIFDPVYAKGITEMSDTRIGVDGVPVNIHCPVVSALTRIVYLDGKPHGYLAIHYLAKGHEFTDYEKQTLEEFTNLLSLSLSRYVARTKNKQLEHELALKRQIADQKNQLEIQQKKLEEALVLANSANEAKSNFLFNMSHDIRTPMNAIIGFTDLAIKNSHNYKKVDESLVKVKNSSTYLLSIVNDILDMAKIESHKMVIQERVLVPYENIDDFISIFEVSAAEKDIKILRNIEGVKPRFIWSDDTHVKQIISNLLTNAIKYTKPGGQIEYISREIPCPKEGYIRVQSIVKDNGIGMSKEFLERIYNSFERESSVIASNIQGTGLGMPIVKNLVDLMGGSIEIESEVNKGTTVTVTLDHRLANEEEKKAALELYQKTNVSVDVELIKGKHALLVEDNSLNQEICKNILEDIGLIVDTADDGVEALEVIKENGINKYDYILTDIQMPRKNGYELTKDIRKLYSDSKVPIIAISANAFEEDKQKSLKAGMNGHIAKPIDINELLIVLSKNS